MATGSGSSDEKVSSLWSQLPSFDPAIDDVREFMQKARFLHGVFPEKEKANLAPTLAMLCKGTAWSQVRMLDPAKLTQPETGVSYLLDALSTWEETSELQTYELFEKAIYKVTQKPDEAAHSFTLRMQAAFNEIGDKATLKEMQAFVLLRQSCLSNEDKKRVLSMSQGQLSLKEVEKAMRALSTRVLLGAGEPKKKIYPTNYTEADESMSLEDPPLQSTYQVVTEEEDALTAEAIDVMAQAGDEDALLVQQFERDLEDLMQEVPDMQTALVTYQEARQRINDRRRGRGFWPVKGKSKGQGKDWSFGGRGGRKGGGKGGKEELLSRISRTHCKICGALGHWKAELRMKLPFWSQALTFLPLPVLALKVPKIMPTRQEVLEALRTLSEEVLSSLRLLFYMLFSMTKAVMPEESVLESDMNPINQLIQEVRNQKGKIGELTQIIESQFMRSMGQPHLSPTATETTNGDMWELAEMEEIEKLPVSHQGATHGVAPNSSQATSFGPMSAMPVAPVTSRVTKIAGISLPGHHSTAMGSTNVQPHRVEAEAHQVALTQTALESWGQKVVTWGKKHKGHLYVNVYEQDVGYVKWVLVRIGNLHEDVEDFGNYATTRRRLEAVAMQNIN
eukprot:s4451_g3.t1